MLLRSSLLQNQQQRAAHLLAFSTRFVLSSWARDGLRVSVWSSWYVWRSVELKEVARVLSSESVFHGLGYIFIYWRHTLDR